MKNEASSLALVKVFAERIDLFGERDRLMLELEERRYEDALQTCQRAIRACLQVQESLGVEPETARQGTAYRAIFHLYQMVENFIVCLEQ